jgi:outer membrane protein assembly factor BamD (BamD/ComL family)
MPRVRTSYRWTAFGAALLLAGCMTPKFPKKMKLPDGDVVQAKHTENSSSAVAHDGLAAAEEAYNREEFEKAEDMFEAIADDKKNRPEVAERARFFHAESLRRQGHYPKAVDTYHKLLLDFPAGLYREQATGQMYLIAREWLQPVQDEIEEAAKPEKERKKRNWVDSIVPANFDQKMPTFDSEGRALQTLERAYFNDPTGPYADKALFMLGRVHYHRENFREAARYFQQLAETYDRSPFRDEALKLAIIAKNNSTGGPQYDARETSEAMRLINNAKATSPQLVREHGKFLDEQALMVRYQQAEKDYQTAEFYRRTGHPGSAWFYYELVKRRYAGIKPWAELAVTRQQELKVELEEMKDTSVMGTTRRYWKQYVLGHELPALKNIPGTPDLKQLPEPRPAAAVPAGGIVPPDGAPPR